MRNKLTLLESFSMSENPDIVIITEHWLVEEEMVTINIINYVVCNYFCRGGSGYGGVIILAKQNINFKKINTIPTAPSTFECCAIIVMLKNLNIKILGLYRAPDSGNIDDFFDYFDETLCKVCDNRRKIQLPIIVCGDFNIDMLTNNSAADRLKESIIPHNLNVLNSTATRITYHSNTQIDLFISNIDEYYSNTKTISSGISDHLAIVLTLNNINRPKLATRKHFTRFFSENSMKEFNNVLLLEKWEQIYQAGTLDTKFKNFMHTFFMYFNDLFPKKLSRRRVGAGPLLPEELVTEGQHLRDWHRALMNLDSPNTKAQYKAKLLTHKNNIDEHEKKSNTRALKLSKNPSKTDRKSVV